MKDWDKYSQSKSVTSALAGSKPSVWEYFCIRVIDNGLLVSIVLLTVLFSGTGLFLQLREIAASNWFYDMAKISFGVLLGMVADKKRTR